MNYRDLQNISNLSQQILVEGANEEHNVLNRWPYTSPYLQESTEVDEGYKDLGDKARDKGHQLLNKSKKTATRGNMYAGTLPSNTPEGENLKQRASQQFAVSAFHNPEKSQAKAAANKERGKGKKKAFGNRLTRSDKQGIKDSYDLYDIILSHLLDEGYAETQEQAEVIMVNMSEDWRDSVVEAYVDYKKGKLPSGRTPQQAAQGRTELLNARDRNRPSNQSPLDGTWGRQQHQNRITKEMDTLTAGNPVSRAVRRGLGDMLPGGEPSTNRHREAMDRRNRVADLQSAEKKSRG